MARAGEPTWKKLMAQAVVYEKTSYKGLFHFINYIGQLQKYQVDMGEAELINDNDDAVAILSIHKSKGLEFPVVLYPVWASSSMKRTKRVL